MFYLCAYTIVYVSGAFNYSQIAMIFGITLCSS